MASFLEDYVEILLVGRAVSALGNIRVNLITVLWYYVVIVADPRPCGGERNQKVSIQ